MSRSGARTRRLRGLWRAAGVTLLLAGSALALADGPPSAQVAAGSQARPLDLSAPPLKLVLTPQQIGELTADHDDDTPAEDVTVERPHYEAPIPVGPFRALPWALLHPLEAWKILMPITDD